MTKATKAGILSPAQRYLCTSVRSTATSSVIGKDCGKIAARFSFLRLPQPFICNRLSKNINSATTSITTVRGARWFGSTSCFSRPAHTTTQQHALVAKRYRNMASITNGSNGTTAANANSTSIVTIGAGVLGLSSALKIQQRHPSVPITVVAAELPTLPATWGGKNARPSADYASMWAGAHYRPISYGTNLGGQLHDEYKLALQTREEMLDIARQYPVEECGVGIMPAAEVLEAPTDVDKMLKDGDVYAGQGDGFRIMKDEELRGYDDSSDTKKLLLWGCEYDTYCVNVHVYCAWLLDRFVQNGGTVVQTRLNRLEDAFEVVGGSSHAAPALVVNCSGRNFDTDPAMKIIRGQTVSVKNLYHRTITRQNSDGTWAFLIPRPGGAGTVVGGTKEIGDLELAPRQETREKLLENAVRYFPDFVNHVSEFEVLADNVGRRPWREGGARIEAENLSSGNVVVHGYGVGGRGYELSWGVAEQVADLVDRELVSLKS